MELPPRLVEELGVGLDAVPEGLDPRAPLLLAAAAAVHRLPPLLRSRGRRGCVDPVLRRGAGVPTRWGRGEEEARVSSSRGCEGREVLERDQKRCSRWDFVICWFWSTFLSLGLYDPNLFLASGISGCGSNRLSGPNLCLN